MKTLLLQTVGDDSALKASNLEDARRKPEVRVCGTGRPSEEAPSCAVPAPWGSGGGPAWGGARSGPRGWGWGSEHGGLPGQGATLCDYAVVPRVLVRSRKPVGDPSANCGLWVVTMSGAFPARGERPVRCGWRGRGVLPLNSPESQTFKKRCIYLRECCVSEGRDTEREKETQAGSSLSTESKVGLDPSNPDDMT